MNVGDVLRVHTTLANPPKTKIVMYVGRHANHDLFLWFNTEPRKRPAQMSVSPREAPVITRDCFLDCSRVTTFPPRELKQAEHQGCASAAFLQRVAQMIEDKAVTLTTGQRRSIAALCRSSW